jgi:hypothetical protein
MKPLRQSYRRTELRRNWVMKTILKIGAAALALSMVTTASAFAQAGQMNSTPAGQGTMPASGQMDNQSGQSMTGQGGMAAPGAATPDQGSMGQGAAQGGMTTGSAETADTPSGSPPSTYPRCTHKGQDRCMQDAANTDSHHMRHRMMMKSKKSTDTNAEASAPAAANTPPAPGQ